MAKLKKGKQKGGEQPKAATAPPLDVPSIASVPPLPIPASIQRTTLPPGGYFKEEFSQAGSVHPDESTQRHAGNAWGSPAGTVAGGDGDDAWGAGAGASAYPWVSGPNMAAAHAGQASPAAGWGASQVETSATGTGSPFVNIQPVHSGQNAKPANARKGASMQTLLSSVPTLKIPPPPSKTAPPTSIPSVMNTHRHQNVPPSAFGEWDTPQEEDEEEEEEEEEDEEDEEGWGEREDTWATPAQNTAWDPPAQASTWGAPADPTRWDTPARATGWGAPAAQESRWAAPAPPALAQTQAGSAAELHRTTTWTSWGRDSKNAAQPPGSAPTANAAMYAPAAANHAAFGRPTLEHQQASLRSILNQMPAPRDPRVQTTQAARDQAYAEFHRPHTDRNQQKTQADIIARQLSQLRNQPQRAPPNPGYAAQAAQTTHAQPQPVDGGWDARDDNGWSTGGGGTGWADPIAEVTEEEEDIDEEEEEEYQDDEEDNTYGYVSQHLDPTLQRKDSGRSRVHFDSGAAQAYSYGATDQYDAWGMPAPPAPPPLVPPPPSLPSQMTSRSRHSAQHTYWGDHGEPLSKTMTFANGRTTTAAFELMPPRNGIGENQFVDSDGLALEEAQRALFGAANSRPAKQRIYWGLTPDKDQRVSSLLRWIHEMANGLAHIGLQKFLQTGQRGALVSNAAYRENTTIGPQPAFDWLPIDELQRTLDHRMQEGVVLYDPGVQVIVYVFLLSKTGNSLAVWRRKLTIPQDVGEAYAEDIKTIKEQLLPHYPVYVDELPVKSEAAGAQAKKPGFFARLFRRKL